MSLERLREDIARIIHPNAWSNGDPYRTPIGDEITDAGRTALANADTAERPPSPREALNPNLTREGEGMSVELLPCPFCGLRPAHDHTRTDGVRFSCLDCDEAAFEDFELAAVFWNRRAHIDSLNEKVAVSQRENGSVSVAESAARIASDDAGPEGGSSLEGQP
jgi:hypothetical protein